MVVRILQVCRAILHNQVKLDQDASSLQNKLAQLGLILPIADLLSSANDAMVRESLAFLVCVLDNGNGSAQNGFIKHFLGTREETFFVDISSRIRNGTENIVEVLFFHMLFCLIR